MNINFINIARLIKSILKERKTECCIHFPERPCIVSPEPQNKDSWMKITGFLFFFPSSLYLRVRPWHVTSHFSYVTSVIMGQCPWQKAQSELRCKSAGSKQQQTIFRDAFALWLPVQRLWGQQRCLPRRQSRAGVNAIFNPRAFWPTMTGMDPRFRTSAVFGVYVTPGGRHLQALQRLFSCWGYWKLFSGKIDSTLPVLFSIISDAFTFFPRE